MINKVDKHQTVCPSKLQDQQGFPKIVEYGMFFIRDHKNGTPRFKLDEKLKLHGFYIMPQYHMNL